MKLPDDPKERKKLYVAMAFGACALLYGIYAGVITPMRNSKTATNESIEELKKQIHGAETLLERVSGLRASNDKVVDDIVERSIRTQNVIMPRLGNYLLVAREIVEPSAERSGLLLESFAAVGVSEIPQHAGRKTKNAFRSYTVRLAISSGVYSFVKLLEDIEKANPFVCIRAISITARPGSPEKHQITLDVQWPTWADAEVREEFLTMIEERANKEVSAE